MAEDDRRGIPGMDAASRVRTYRTGRGEVVRATMPDAEALAIVRGLGEDGDAFALDLTTPTANRRGPSPSQWAWIHKLATRRAGTDLDGGI